VTLPPADSSSSSTTLPPGLLGIPAGAWMWTESVLSLFQVLRGMPAGSRMSMARNAASSSIAANRNKLVEDFSPRHIV
jgi:hypothetical protein